MDKFVQIDTSIRNNKNVVVDRDGALIEFYPHFLTSTESNNLYKELHALTTWHIGETMTKGGLKMTSRLVMGLINPKEPFYKSPRGKILEDGEEPFYKSPQGKILEDGEEPFYKSPQGKILEDDNSDSHTFTPLLLAAHEKIKKLTGETFNYAYLNFYRDGNDHIGFHSDREEQLEEGSTIASLSLGATRDFVIRHIKDTKLAQEMKEDYLRLEALEKAKQTISLKSGSLLLMKKLTQKVYHHQVPKRTKVKSPRINITFRHIREVQEN